MHAGIDLSTTTARCVLLDTELNVIAVGRHRHTGLADKLRQHADRWISSVQHAVDESAAAAGVGVDRIISVGVATQGVASVLVDDTGMDLDAAQGWLSAGDEPTPELSAATIESWYERSGRRISLASLAARLLRNNGATSGRWALAGDLIAHRLTGQWSIDPCLAATSGLLDQCTGDWSASLMAEAGIDRASLSRIGPPGTVAGHARGALAVRLGLSPETPVAFPTQDQRAAVLVADPDERSVTVTFGTAVAIVRRAGDCSARLSASIPLTPGLQPDTWWHEGVVPAAGITFDWCAELMGLPTTGAWLDLAGEIEVGAAGAVCEPWFGGRGSAGWDSAATGALKALQLGTSRSEVARAVVDGVCEEIVRNVELLGPSSDVRIVGRAAAHPVLARTIATLLSRPVTRVISDEPTGYGAALLGCAGGWTHRVGARELTPRPPLRHGRARKAGTVTLLVGVATSDVSPPVGTPLGGYPVESRVSSGVHDQLQVVAVSVRDDVDGDHLVVLCFDGISVPAALVSGVDHGVHVVAVASHTHSAPSLEAWDQGVMGAYSEELPVRSRVDVSPRGRRSDRRRATGLPRSWLGSTLRAGGHEPTTCRGPP